MKKVILAVMSFFTIFIAIFGAWTYLDGSYNKNNAHNAHIDLSEFANTANLAFNDLSETYPGGARSLFESVNEVFRNTQYIDSDWGIGGINKLINQPANNSDILGIINTAAKIFVGLIGNILLLPMTLILAAIAVIWWIAIYIGQLWLLAFSLLSGGFIIFA